MYLTYQNLCFVAVLIIFWKKCDLHIIDYTVTPVVKNLIQQKYPKINDNNIIYWWMGFNILEQTKTLGSLGHITYNQGSSSHATALKHVDLSTLYTTIPDFKLKDRLTELA